METCSGGNHTTQTQCSQSAEDSNTCVICSEAWKRSGSHCAVSLACGHLFGKKCIEKWIQSRAKRYAAKDINCPMCNKIARLVDLRHVIPSRIAAKDTAIADQLKAELEKKKVQIKADERFLDQSRLALAVLNNQIKSRKAKLKHKQVSEKPIMTPPALDTKPDTPIPAAEMETIILSSQERENEEEEEEEEEEKEEEKEEEENIRQLQNYRINFSHRISGNRNVSRVMAVDTCNQTAYISFKSTESESGIIKLNPERTTSIDFLPIHTGLIKDVKHNNDGLIVTTSLDKSVKITSTISNEVTYTVSLPLPGWSCCFDPDDSYRVACGLSDSRILIYDRRNTRTFVQQLSSSLVSKTPLHSMFFKSVNHESKIYCSNLNQTFIWDNTQSTCTFLRLDGYGDFNPYSLSEHGSHRILLSSRNKTSTKHQLLDFGSHNSNTPTIVSTFDSAVPQKGFARTYSYTPQDTFQNPTICYGDEASGTLNLIRRNRLFQHFNIHSCPLDIKLFDSERLAFLTDNRFFLLKPSYIHG